jgi:hypothetical protein
MNDDFLKKLALLEKSLEELKADYLRRGSLPEIKPAEPASLPVSAPVPAAPPVESLSVEAPPAEPKTDNGLIKIAPRQSTPPEVKPSLPPVPDHDMRTIRIKAPQMPQARPETGFTKEECESDVPNRMVIEWFVGRKLFGSLGMLLVLVGLCYGVVYAYQNFHLSPELRVGAACGFSILIAAVGFLLRNPSCRFLSLLMKGGGLGGLYIAIFAGYNFYGFFGVTLTGAALMGVALLTFALSWFERSQVTGVFAVIGAFAMPLLVKTPNPNHVFFCFYILCVNLPVILLGLRRNWQTLYNLSFILSFLLGWGWTFQYREITTVTMTFWSVFTVEYLLLAIIKLRSEYNIAHRLPDYVRLAALPLLNLAVLYLPGERIALGCWLYAGTLLYAAATAAAWLTVRRMYGEFILLLGATAAFLALAVQETVVGEQGVYLAWAVEALALGVFAFFSKNRGINRLATLMALAAWFMVHADYWFEGDLFGRSLFFNYVNVLGKLALLALLIQGGLGLWRFEKSLGSKAIILLSSFGLIAITSLNAGYYFLWREPFLFFTALPLAVASLIYGWAAHLTPRFNCLKYLSTAWFVGILASSAALGNFSSLWQLFWPFGALALYWALPRGNWFRPFAAASCIMIVFQSMNHSTTVTGFLNLPFLTALAGGVCFLALTWTPPWLRADDRPAGPIVPHGIAWGILLLAGAFCVNFCYLKSIYPAEYLFPEFGATLIAATIVLACLARRGGNRILTAYGLVLLMLIYLLALADCLMMDKGIPFFGVVFYGWLVILAVSWGVLRLFSGTMNAPETLLLRIFGGSLMIFIICREFGNLPDPAFAKAFSLIFLTLTAVLICGWGLWKQRRAARFYSFVLLGIAIVQLIAQSLLRLKDPARILAFIALGLLLLGLSFAYHKVSELVDARNKADGEDDGNH